MTLKSGKLRGSKDQYEDGVFCCIWYATDEGDENAGERFDLAAEDVSDLRILLEVLEEATFTDDDSQDKTLETWEDVFPHAARSGRWAGDRTPYKGEDWSHVWYEYPYRFKKVVRADVNFLTKDLDDLLTLLLMLKQNKRAIRSSAGVIGEQDA